MSRRELSRALGVSEQAIAQWLSGETQPTGKNAAQLEDLLGIPMRAWQEASGER